MNALYLQSELITKYRYTQRHCFIHHRRRVLNIQSVYTEIIVLTKRYLQLIRVKDIGKIYSQPKLTWSIQLYCG